jgi:hypothetical protein
MYLQVTLPAVPSSSIACFRWVDWVGHALIRSVEMEIGGQRIDKHYGDWLHIWNELTQNAGHKDGYAQMVGQVPELTSAVPAGGVAETTLYVPLEFWFCRNPGLALPLISLQYHEVKVNLEFRDKSEVCVCPANQLNLVPSIKAGSLYVDYIYLDTDERRRFAQVSHEYLIEQLQFTGDESVTSRANKIKLNFNHPVKELVWVVQCDGNVATNSAKLQPPAGATSALNGVYTGPQWFNYTDAAITLANGVATDGVNPVQTAKLQLNGHDRFSEREGKYFNLVQPYQHHTNVPTDVGSAGINVYSFGLKPEEHQPSGTCNMSRIDTATLQLSISSEVLKGPDAAASPAKVRIYACSYNVLRVMSGMGGLNVFVNHIYMIYKQTRTKKQQSLTNRDLVKGKYFVCSIKTHQLLVFVVKNPQMQHILLFGKPLTAFLTKVDCESVNWPRVMNSGMVISERIGQSACLLPNSAMIANGRASETERIWVVNDGLINLKRLKIQSIPLGKLRGSRVLTAIRRYKYNHKKHYNYFLHVSYIEYDKK